MHHAKSRYNCFYSRCLGLIACVIMILAFTRIPKKFELTSLPPLTIKLASLS